MLLSKLRSPEVMLLLVALIWGTSYGVAKGALVFYPVLGFLSVRFVLTFMALLPFLRGQWRKALKPGCLLGSVLLAIYLSETFGVAHTSASNAAFLISLCVVITPWVEWAMFRRRPTAQAFGYAALSLLGAFMLTGGRDISLNTGDGLMLLAALLRALMVCFTRKLLQNTDIPTVALTAVQVGVVGFGSLIILLCTTGSLPPLPSAPDFWVATVYLVLFCTLFAFFAQNAALRHTTPSRASLLMGAEPLFGACFAVLWLGEQLSVLAWCGGLLIVLASLLGTRPVKGPGLAVRPVISGE